MAVRLVLPLLGYIVSTNIDSHSKLGYLGVGTGMHFSTIMAVFSYCPASYAHTGMHMYICRHTIHHKLF